MDRTLINKEDIISVSRGYLFAIPSFLESRLKPYMEPRDRPIVSLFFDISVVILPPVVLLLLIRQQYWWMAPAVFFLNLYFFQERFLLALHYSQHRPPLSGPLRYLNEFPHGVLCILYGLPPLAYHLHHCIMHHREDNQVYLDLSATEQYQRDQWSNWVIYWLRHAILIFVELPKYAFSKKMYSRGASVVCVGMFYLFCVWKLLRYNAWATFWLLGMPYLVGSALLMFGNWSQHIFVDPDDPRDDYKLTYNCINSRVNKYAFNDGYHITHHLFPGCHWSDLPLQFHKTRKSYAEHKAFLFNGLDFFEVGFFVMTKKWEKLAEHLVNAETGEVWPKEEAIKELKRRVLPVPLKNSEQKKKD